jgi:FKBP-type peptidyl-prolyl cis-trans isomerase FkpA
MIKRLFIFSTVIILLSSCIKTNDVKCTYQESTFIAPVSEVNSLQAWVNTYHPGAIKHSSGLFYEIVNPGSGTAVPAVCSNITVKYTGTLTTGAKFDENLTGFSSVLGSLILGWQKGVPLIKSSGTIILYLPPSLGYGAQDIKDNSGVVVIPANSILVFNVQLIAVQ